MELRRIPENHLDESIYQATGISKLKWIGLSILLFGLTFFFYFPFENKIMVIIQTSLVNNSFCPMNYDDLKLSYLPPKITFKKLMVPGRCFKPGSDGLELNNLTFKLISPAFPLGGIFNLQTRLKQSKLNSSLKITPGGGHLRIEKGTLIKVEDFSSLLPVRLAGNIDIQSLAEFEGEEITEVNIITKSSNFRMPGQTLNRFTLPELNLKNFFLKGFMRNKVFKIAEFKVGHKDEENQSPFILDLKGVVKIQKSPMDSDLDLEGELILSEEFKEKFGFIIKSFLKGSKEQDGAIALKIGGKLSSPSFN